MTKPKKRLKPMMEATVRFLNMSTSELHRRAKRDADAPEWMKRGRFRKDYFWLPDVMPNWDKEIEGIRLAGIPTHLAYVKRDGLFEYLVRSDMAKVMKAFKPSPQIPASNPN